MLPNKRRKSRKRTETEHPRLRTVRCLPGTPSQRTYHRSFCGLRSVFPERTGAASASYSPQGIRSCPPDKLYRDTPASSVHKTRCAAFSPSAGTAFRHLKASLKETITASAKFSAAHFPLRKKAPSFLSCRNEIDRTARFSRFGGLTRQNLSGVLICARKRAIL